MISLPLLKRDTVQVFKPMLIFMAVLAMYTGVIVYMYNPALMSILSEYANAFPGMMQAVGMTGVATNLIEFMSMYLYGFLMLVIPMLYIIVIGNSLIMRYVDSGSVACLLASPNSRLKLIVTQAVSMICGITVLMIFITGSGIMFSEMMFPGELAIKTYLMLNGSALLVQLAVGSIAFAAACFFNESKNYYAVGAGLPILFYLINMLANMGDKLKNLKFFSLYTLFPKDMIVAGDSGSLWYNIALAVIAVSLFAFGIIVFTRKDFSI